VKSGAEQAATKAQVELDRLSIKRELSGAYEALGTKAFELADRGELSHAELEDSVNRIRELQAQLAAVGQVGQNADETSPQADPPAEETTPTS
jgi:hydrogenase maturation factor